MHILHVVGARPNLMKVAPVLSALKQYFQFRQTLIHTGQHYDTNMSDVFFQQLEIPAPDVNLGVGSGSHARQTAEIMTRFEPIVLERKPGSGPGLWRRQFHRCRRTGLLQTPGSGRPRGSGTSLLRPQHAGRDQPPGHGPIG